MSDKAEVRVCECTEIPSSIDLSETDFSNVLLRQSAINSLMQAVDGNMCERELYRPHISVPKLLLNVFIPLAIWCTLFCALYFSLRENTLAISLGVSLGALGLYILIRLRSIFIWCIRVYQRFAPARVRLRCVFTPSCSEYAIQALQKYGVLRGVPKILARLLRCHYSNGGEDLLK